MLCGCRLSLVSFCRTRLALLSLPYLRIFTPSVGNHTGSSVCKTSALNLYTVIYPPPNAYVCAQIKTD
jgi:hypothetical protein